MATTANALLENCCDPCPCDSGCKNDCPVNIQSTNPNCLRVDTSECGVVKLEPKCPKPTFVKAGDNVTVKDVTPPDDCFIDGGDCDVKGGREVSATDEKVKACPSDTTPGTLTEKLVAGTNITITPIGCDGDTNSKLKISVSKAIPDEVEIPIITIDDSGSQTVSATVTGKDKHHIVITDKIDTTYDNMCCIGFESSQVYTVRLNNEGNASAVQFEQAWGIYTGNPKMATTRGIKILKDGYYRVFGQLTVWNNYEMDADAFYINLGRGLLHIDPGHARPTLSQDHILLSTAKHGAYGRQTLLLGKDDIDISDGGKISSGSGDGQTNSGFDGPWMTFNIDCLVDLYEDDILTLGYRPQSDMPEAKNRDCSFSFVGQDDSSTEYDALFGGTLLGVHMLAPKLFQQGAGNQTYARI